MSIENRAARVDAEFIHYEIDGPVAILIMG
jgi:hypothetical protein